MFPVASLPVPDTARAWERRDLLAFAIIAAPFVIGWLLVSPWQNVPVIDDWVYAWSVEHLIKTRQLRVVDWSAIYPVTQILWGALFARILGFSFGALRLSTVVAAVAGCWALYLTFRELAIPFSSSVLGALSVALHPVYFALAFSFMTDVPFVSAASIALFFYVSALQRQSVRRLWWGSAAAVAAFLIRPIVIVIPLAALSGAVWTSRRAAASVFAWRRSSGPIVTGIVVMILLWVAIPYALGTLEGAKTRLEWMHWLLDVPARQYAI